MRDAADPMRRALGWAWFAWCVFVAYGSLLPFDLRPVPWDQAVQSFTHLPWLKLGLGSRLDWLANLLVYFPLGFLGTAAALAGGHEPSGRRRGLPSWLAAAAVLGLGAALALAIEFAQIFIAPRTVSLNDLVAEWAGTALGCAAGLALGRPFTRLIAGAAFTPASPRAHGLRLYALAYVALSFFPFDFSTASAVFEQKLANGHAGWWIAAINAGDPLRFALKLFGEVLLTMPFGWSLARRPVPVRWPAATLLGLGLGALIELSQLFLLSATSQGISVVSRAVGFAAGALLVPHAARLNLALAPAAMRVLVVAASVPWLLTMAYLAGWGRSPVAVDGWWERAASLHYLPFYYHYYAGEAWALTSVLQYGAVYAWVGIVVGLLWASPRPRLAVALAAGLAIVLESSQLILVGQRPDPTNVLIAAAAAWFAHAALHRLRWRAPAAAPSAPRRGRPEPPAQLPAQPATAPASATQASAGARAWPWLAAAVIVGAVHAAPGSLAATLLALTAYVACVWRLPHTALFLVPVAIGLTDVTTYTGPRWLDVLDWAMLATGVLAFVHPAARRRHEPGPRRLTLALWLLLGLAPGALIGLTGLDVLDPNALLTPLSPGWGAMQVKGLLWAVMLALFVHRLGVRSGAAAAMLGRGMVVALAGVVWLTVWERLSFVGPFDFASDYRAPGPFSAISLGGAFIEAFLVAATPFAVVAAMQERSRPARWASALLVLGAAYATMITFSRAGQVVFLGAVAGTLALLLARRFAGTAGHRRMRGGPRGWLLVLAVGAVSGAVLLAPYATQRFANLGPDARGRLAHWSEGLGFGRDDTTAWLFGNGAGSFGREAYVLGDPKTRPGIFSLEREAGNTWLRSRQGSLSYLDQRVDVGYGEPLRVSARLRTTDGRGIEALLCEKDLVQSRTCAVARLRIPADGQWHAVSVPVTLPPNPMAGWPTRPVRLTLFSAGGGVVDIDELSLMDAQGQERLRNGNFEAGPAHWLYSSDRHLTWHMKNLWLHVFFEYGLAGVLAHAGLLLAGLVGAWRAAAAGQPTFLAVGVGLLAFHGVGLVDSVIDTSRFLQLYLSLVAVGCVYGLRATLAGRPGRVAPAATRHARR